MSASAADIALRLLARREHSRRELRQKLRARGIAGDAIDAALEELSARGVQSDARYAAAYVRQKRAQLGKNRLRLALAQQGVAQDLIADALRGEGGDDAQTAAAVIAKKYPDGVPAARLAQARRFLQQRGFGAADGDAAIKAHRQDDAD